MKGETKGPVKQTKPKAKPKPIKRLTRSKFDALNKEDQKAYLERYKTSKFRRPESTKDKTRAKKRNPLTVTQQVKAVKAAGAGVINQESVNAMSRVTPQQLAAASITIKEKRNEILDEVEESLKDSPSLLVEGAEGLSELMRGEGGEGDGDNFPKPLGEEDDEDADSVSDVDSDGDSDGGDPDSDDDGDEDDDFDDDEEDADFDDEDDDFDFDDDEDDDYEDEDDDYDDDYDDRRSRKSRKSNKSRNKGRGRNVTKRSAAKTLLFHLVKVAIVTAGISALAIGAGPIAMVVGRSMLDMWDAYGQDMMGTASAGDDTATFTEDHRRILGEVLTQTSDFMRFMNKDDLEEGSKIMFKAIATINPQMEPSADRNHSNAMRRAFEQSFIRLLEGGSNEDTEDWTEDEDEDEQVGPVKLRS